ncbi:hypothetical protein ADN00_15750 [Ornatilinea apprima]|uniref:Phage portal protein n=2 Tax=Ornatilinea apprima TaxID=1134406 RepID=A0A0P6WZL5_9CHLR|nr:hypothetical protein ADN00_15750 [Ornatilinea apprima]
MAGEADFNSFEARKFRYDLYWSYYENTAYSKIHAWARIFKSNYGLYKAIRGIYNPAYRLGEFWKTHLWGGPLDPFARNDESTATPIQTQNEDLRGALAQVWRWSNWQTNKNICALWGTVLGDVAIKVIDDVQKRKVFFEIIHPGTIKSVDLDKMGNVKGYVIEQELKDPENLNRFVVYREVASRNGDEVVYELFKNDAPYAWGNEAHTWSEPYGFVPMVFIRHNNVGLNFGFSEYQGGHAKFREVDDVASKLSDQIRKMVDAPWLFSGVSKPTSKARTAYTEASDQNELPIREETPVFYGPVGSSAYPLVSNLNISDTAAYVKDLLEILEKDYPELNSDLLNVKGDISGRALRVNQRPTENKVRDRRVNYDDALVRAQMMAVAIGGFRHYDGFEGFDLESYDKGDLDHSIADRPVFQEDKADELELEQTFWNVAKSAKSNGMPLPLFLERHGWSDEDILKITNSEEYKARLEAFKQIAALSEGSEEGETEIGEVGQAGDGSQSEED